MTNTDSPTMSPTSTTVTPGIAGRTDYASWDKLTRTLNADLDDEEAREQEEASQLLGNDGKYSVSQAQQDERNKAAQVKKVKEQLERYQERENAVMATFRDVFADKKVRRLTRKDLDAGKRVITLCDSQGAGTEESSIVLTQDLSLLESQITQKATPKSYADDAENAVVETNTQPRKIYGIIKVFLQNLQNCTVHVKCKMITGTLEIHQCRNLKVVVHSTATVATVQADVSQDVTIQFRDAPSGKHDGIARVGTPQYLYWGQDANDRILHAGVTNLKVECYKDDDLDSQIVSDYLQDGAEAIGNATAEEMQFVTSFAKNELVTERIVRQGSSTGANVRAMTQRELDQEESRRQQAAERAVSLAEDMIQIKDKNGNVIVKIEEPPSATEETEAMEEMVSLSVQAVVAECEQNKARGNEAFGAGEYGQAILLYSLALDKASELPEDATLFPRDVVYSNRAASFLKLGQHDKALQDAEAALAVNPDNLKALFRQGLSLHAMGQYFQALPILAQAHQKEPRNQQIKQALQFCEVRVQQEHRKRMQG